MHFIQRAHKTSFQRLAVLLLILTGLLLWSFGAATAQEKDTSVFYAWDSTANKYQNSMVLVNVNTTPTGVWVPMLHHLDFDDTPYAPQSCSAQANNTTMYAGLVYLGLYHTDNAPKGAMGFVESRKWSIVKCDRDGDGTFANGDLYMAPPTDVTLWGDPANLILISQDVPTPCTTGNCEDEIVTTLEINLDQDCDGVIDTPIPDGGLCFYAEGFLSSSLSTPWKGPLQGRFADAAGDKTVNFEPFYGPNSIRLASLTARSPMGFSGLLMIAAGLFSACFLALDTFRKTRR